MLKIISGAQTGVDRAALDAALDAGLPCGGWIPRGRLAEDGTIDGNYSFLKECDSSDYIVRTELNVQEADATLILHRGPMSGGTEITHAFCRRYKKPVLALDLAGLETVAAGESIIKFLRQQKPKVLNVAGPRESKVPGIYEETQKLLAVIFTLLVNEK